MDEEEMMELLEGGGTGLSLIEGADEDDLDAMIAELEGDDDDDDDDDVEGDDVIGSLIGISKKKRRARRRRKKRKARMLAKKARWRQQMAPGISMPGYGVELLSLEPDRNGGVFDDVTPVIRFVGEVQRPFRGQRLVSTVVRTGAAGVALRGQSIFVGTQLQQLSTSEFNIELFAGGNFGVAMRWDQATPGMKITIPVAASAAIAVGESITVSLDVLGQSAR